MATVKKGGGKPRGGNGSSGASAQAGGGGRRSTAAASETEFDQGGPDGAAKQRGKGDNSKHFTAAERADQVAEYLELVDETDAAIAANNRECSLKNQPLRKKATKAAGSLVKDGVVATRVLTKIVQKHRKERDLARIDHTLNDEEKADFASIQRGLVGLAGSPLGDFALAQAAAQHAH